MNVVWTRFLGAIAALAVVALIVWPVAGSGWALALLAAGLAVLLLHHVRNLAAFVRWLSSPQRDTLPIGSGIWETAFAQLHRHFGTRDEAESQVAAALARFRAAGQALPDGVVILNRDYQIEWANPTAQLHLDIDALRDTGQAITNLLRNPQGRGNKSDI